MIEVTQDLVFSFKKISKMYFVRALCTRTAEQTVKQIVFMLRQLTKK